MPRNLRILKKLSKRAAPLLPLLGDTREQFKSEKWDNYTGLIILERKHWERGRSVHADLFGEHTIKYQPKGKDYWIYLKPPSHPRKGTVMVGAISGYYEPEWDEETAWEALERLVFDHHTDWFPALSDDGRPVLLRDLSTPTLIFQAAQEIITAKGSSGNE